jgi:phage gpG-like protein
MAKATFVKVAMKAIFEQGKYVQYVSKKGKREGQTLNKLDRTIPRDENDKVFIEKGESYFWWSFQYGGKNYSKEQPKRSQLTQSNYLSQLYDLQDRIEDITADSPESLESAVSELIGEFESLRDETQESLDNMPESLQSSPTGELLQERIDCLDGVISELEDIDCDYEEPDEDEIKDEIADDEGITPDEKDWDDDLADEQIQEKKDEKLQEWLDERISEIQDISTE